MRNKNKTKAHLIEELEKMRLRIVELESAEGNFKSAEDAFKKEQEIEKTLEEGRRFAENVLENSAVATFVLDPQHRVVLWNKACEELTGVPAYDMIGTSDHWRPFYDRKRPTLSDIVVDGRRENLPDLYSKHTHSVLKSHGVNAEGWFKNLNGKDRYIIFDAAPIYNSKGELSVVIETLLDITAQKLLEQDLAQNERKLRTTIETVPECVKLLGADGTLLEMNPAGLSMIEADSLEEVVGYPVNTLVVPQYRGAFDELSEKIFKGETGTLEFELLTLKGNRIWVETQCAPLKNEKGEITSLLAVSHDVTQRKQMENEREELLAEIQVTLDKVSHSQKMWTETFDSIGDLISVHDGDFNIVRVNRAFAQYFGLAPRDVIGKKCYEFFHEDNLPAHNCPHRMTLDEKRPATVEHLNQKTNTIFRISTFPFTIPGNESHGSIHIVRDITEEKEKEMRLIMSERLAALGQMASGVAHEINNPLAGILGCAEGLLSRVKKGQFNPELFENYLGIIEEEVSRCKSITTSMLSFVRKKTYEKKEINVNDDLDKALEIIGFQGRLKNVTLIRNYMPESPIICGNEGELRQAFTAIITNALDAVTDSGILTIETGMEGGMAFVIISDSGPGISDDVIAKIFDPFFTTKSETGGTGLGLAIANKIIVNHHGGIKVSAEQGKGTTFKITLPIEA